MTEKVLSWDDLANQEIGTVEKPRVIPVGHYIGVFNGKYKSDNAGAKKTPLYRFEVALREPCDDVDAQELEASSGIRDSYDCEMWMTPNSLWRFTELAQGLGAEPSMNIPASAEFIVNCGEPVVFELKHQEGKNGNIFVKLENPVPLSKWEG